MSARLPLILLPGLLCDDALWTHQAKALAYLAEVRIADLTGEESVGGLAESVLASAPPRFALAGLSMGGYVALEIMRRAPERVDRLCLMDTSARADTPEHGQRRRGLIELAEKGRFKGVTPMLLPLLLHPNRLSDAVLTGTVMDMAERVGRDAFLRQQRAIMGRPDSRPDLAGIDCPVMVVCGREDALTPPEMAEEIAAGIPEARLRLIPECGHLATLEQPEAATAAMRDWLTV